MPTKPIEAGKFYRLRNGDKYLVLTKNPFGNHPRFESDCFIGITSEFLLLSHSEIGSYHSADFMPPEEHNFDIVAEWEEPKAPRVVELFALVWKDRADDEPRSIEVYSDEYYAKAFQEKFPEIVTVAVRKIRYTEGGKIEDVTDE